MRQWVVTFPRQVRYHLATDPALASAALREVTGEARGGEAQRPRAAMINAMRTSAIA